MAVLKNRNNLKVMYTKTYHVIVSDIMRQTFSKTYVTIKVVCFKPGNINFDGNCM
jgi:hypothetical protein